MFPNAGFKIRDIKQHVLDRASIIIIAVPAWKVRDRIVTAA